MTGSGYEVNIGDLFAENHRKYSLILLRATWAKAHFLFHGPAVSKFFIPSEKGTIAEMQVFKIHGIGWINTIVLPFALLHESLHFIIGIFTPRDKIIALIPPFLDILIYPLWFVFAVTNPGFLNTNHFLFLGLTLWICWCWMTLLISNLSGDFRHMLARQESQKPETEEPEIAEPVTTVP